MDQRYPYAGWTPEQIRLYQFQQQQFQQSSQQMPTRPSHYLQVPSPQQYGAPPVLYSSAATTVRPAYVQVRPLTGPRNPQPPPPPQQQPTQSSTSWPDSLKKYVKRVYETCPPDQKHVIEEKLRNFIKELQTKNAIWTTDWSSMTLPQACLDHQAKRAVAAQKKRAEKNNSKSLGKKVTLSTVQPPPPPPPQFVPPPPSVPAPPPPMTQERYRPPPAIIPPSNTPLQPLSGLSASMKKVSNLAAIMQEELAEQQAQQKESKKKKKMGLSASSLDQDMEIEMRAARQKRFGDRAVQEAKKRKKALASAEKARAAFLLAGAQGNPDVIDWDEDTVIGTCKSLEKSYLRITSAVDPSTVRPLQVLQQSLVFLIDKWKTEANYTYICDQLKSVRQDLTVQRIKNDFTVKVYETHARIAIEKGDLGEFNQCQGQLKDLYQTHNLPGHRDEFLGYRILYMVHTNNKTELVQTIAGLSDEQKKGESVSHALAVRSAVATSNYYSFFSHYMTAPFLSGYLMDQFVDRERVKALTIICAAFRPSFGLVDLELGFVSLDEALEWFKEYKIPVSNPANKPELDTKAALGVIHQHWLEMNSKGVDIKGQIH